MDPSKSAPIWRRWWILTVVLLLLTLAGAASTATRLRTYQSDSSVLLLASRSAARLTGGNPYLSFSPSLTLTADAVGREIMAPATVQHLASRGFRDSYTVGLAPFTTNTTGSVLLVSVTGIKKAAVERTLHAVTSEIGTVLQQLQVQNGVKKHNRIRALTLSHAMQATLDVTKTARPVVSVAAIGLLLTFGIPVVADGLLTRRRTRRAIRRGRTTPERASGFTGPLPARESPDARSAADNGRAPEGRMRAMTGRDVDSPVRYRQPS